MTTPPEALRAALAHLDQLALAHAHALVALAQIRRQEPPRPAYIREVGEGLHAVQTAYERLAAAADAFASLP